MVNVSYYSGRNLKIDKINNKISCELASSNWRDFKDRLVFEKVDDLYSKLNRIEDKIANLYYDVICGNIHITGKYIDLRCSYSYFNNFVHEFESVLENDSKQDLDLYNVYLKYKTDFDRYTVKNCVLRQKGYNNRYVVRINKYSLSINYGKEKARKFNDIRVKSNKWYMDEFEIEYI